LPKTAELWYATDQKNGEAATITYRAWDTTTGSAGSNVDTSSNGGTTAFSAATDTATLTVTDVNDAPVLTAASPSLGLTNQTTPVTIPLSGTFISHGSGTTTSTDVDNGAVVGGIALQGTTGRNAWSYSLDGTTFSPVGTVSGTSALLLPNTAQLRYAADGIHSETATITYRAWDTTSGTAGSKVYPSNIGGSTAFSSVTDVASLTIDYTAPRVSITTPVLTGGTLDAGTSALAITFSEAVTGGGTAANYQLQSAGPDGLLGTADDVIVPLTVSYSGTMATLGFPALPGDVYRLTVHDTLTDAAGNKLDGNGDGHAGGDWVTDFVLVPTSFIGPPTTVTSSNALSVAVGDFNGDGHADLAVVGSFFGVGGIFLGDGKGGFSSDGTFNTGGQDPVTVAAADLNRDGRLDLIAVNYVSNTVSVLLGSGNGTFGTATTFSSGGTDPQCLAVADFNGDGKLDVAITNWASNTVGILLGDGGGGLGNVATFSTGGGWPYAITAADFNGDGALDLAVANRGSANVGILLGNGAGSFGTATSFSSGGSQPQGIAVGDFNGDGKMDVVVSNNTSNTVGILLGNGTGALGAVTTFGSGQTKPMGMAVADFNGDGHADIAVANAGGLVGILVGNGAGSFAAASTLFSGGSNPQGVAIGDFNGDGRPDLAMPSSSSGVVGILLNTDDLAPATFTSPHGLNFDVALVV
jgi:hypothetical protein